MHQITFSDAEYQIKKRKTRREVFLERTDKLIPWKQLEKPVVHSYSKSQNGRSRHPLSAMLRVHCMQLFDNLWDPAAEDAESRKIKASVRAKVQHPFRCINQIFGYGKVCCRGLAKNNSRLHFLAAFSNLLIGERYLLA